MLGAQPDAQIGLVGLGLVGSALARRLRGAGYRVHGYDKRNEANVEADKLGVAVASDVSQIARENKLIVLSLLTSEDRRALLWGEQSMASALQPDTTILDTTTGRPDDIVEDSVRLAGQGVRLVDVCLSGSSQVVEEGRALALVGDSEGNAMYTDVLRAISKRQYFIGGPGQGNRMKLIVNLVFGLHRAVLAEALGLAARGGFDLDQTLDILKEGETYSVAMDTKGPRMISRTYTPAVARLAQHAKDVDLILEYGRSIGAPTPLSLSHQVLLHRLVEAGFGDLDNAAIFEAYAVDT